MSRTILLLVLLPLLLAPSLKGQEVYQGRAADQVISGSEMIRMTSKSDAPNYVRLRQDAVVPETQFRGWLQKVLKMGDQDELVYLNEIKDQVGYVHYRYQQTFKGFPVEGSMVLLHSKAGNIDAVNGDFFPHLNLACVSFLNEKAALQRALDHISADVYKWELPGEEEFIKAEKGDPNASFYPKGELVIVPSDLNYQNPEFKFAFKFNVYAHSPMSRNLIYIDARTGEIVGMENRIHTVDSTGIAVTKYSGTQTIITDFTGSLFRLRESGRGNGIETYDMNQGTSYNNSVDFTDNNNNWNNVNAQQDEVATDAHWGAERTYDYFLQNFNRNSINGTGFTLLSYVHYGSNYNNAFWDGSRMTYGDGNGSTFTPLTAVDVTGHEITHGLTNFTANLVYSYESGALNESFSDIFGAAIEHFADSAQFDWKIGEDMTPNNQGIRNMENPNLFNDPDTYLGTSWWTSAGDNGGVHTNSGVQNKWYQLLVEGGTGTNDNNQSYSVTGLGFSKADQIAFRNLTVYLTPSSQYADARFYGIQSAIDLYGPCSPEVISTTNAWHAVGVGNAFVNTIVADFTATPIASCKAPAPVQFKNLSINGGNYLWDFGDGTTSTALNPSHTYTNLGTYPVSLIAYGGPCGNDTLLRVGYVSVDTNNSCAINLNANGSNSIQNDCNGTLYDTGGPTGDYGPNTNSIITISPSNASTVTLTFTTFDFENGFDYLLVYDGPSITSPLIGRYTGNTLPNNGSITSTFGSITLRQTSDQAQEEDGFAVNWTCNLPTAAPNTDFVADNRTSCSGVVQFTDRTTGGPTSWAWDFGDGFTSTQQHPQHSYAANGTYTVRLTTTNSFGNDTETKTTYITVSKPAGPAAPAVSRCGPGSVTLNASGSGSVVWYDQASGGTPVGSGSSFNTPSLTNSIVYYAEERTPGPSNFVGPFNNNIGGGGFHNNNSTQYLIFTVLDDITFASAWYRSGGSGNRTITLWDDATGNVIRDTTVNLAAGIGALTLNWKLTPGDYRIGGTQMNLYRNNSGPSYPYTLTNQVIITGSSAGNDYYYYLYNWEIKGRDCVSDRTPVPVSINPAAAADFSYTQTANTVDFKDNSAGSTGWSWDFGDGNTSTMQNPTHVYTAVGTYYVEETITNGDGCTAMHLDTVEVIEVSIDQGLASELQSTVYPNPVVDEARISMVLPKAGDLSISLMDIAGRKLASVFSGRVTPGAFEQVWTAPAGLADGVYFLRFDYDERSFFHKVVLSH